MATPQQPFQPGTAVVPPTQVEISISCRNLADKDVFSKSDPMCVVFMKGAVLKEKYREVGRTEVIKDTLNPDFVKKVVVDYYFEESQKMKFEVYDKDSSSDNLHNHDFLGLMECTLGEIVAAQGNKVKKKLRNSGVYKEADIIVSADEVGLCKDVATMQFCGVHLDKKDFFGKSDPFLIFSKCNEDTSYTVVHKTEVIKYTLNPTWRPFSIPLRKLCNADLDKSIRIDCYDWDSDGGHDFIGSFQTNARILMEGPGESNVYECINPKKQAKKKKYQNSGVIKLLSIKIAKEHTFLDFIKGGMQMNFTVAIDFTASNGNPQLPNSLHYIHPSMPNQYYIAIKSVGEIIQDYDSDKMFPALGFGARIPPDGQVSHEFFLTGNPANPFCAGVEGILEAYQRSLHTVQLYGPTNFAPVINHVARFASAYSDGSNYFVLLIITDGIISDMYSTKAAIVQAAKFPMSIIIVGVGNEDFHEMEILDGDTVRLSHQGQYAERDIVQFVPIREFLNNASWDMSQSRLAKEVLAEIPDQVVAYMKQHNIQPKPPPTESVPSPISRVAQDDSRPAPPPPPAVAHPPPPVSAANYANEGQSWAQPPMGPSHYPPGGYASAPGYPPGAPPMATAVPVQGSAPYPSAAPSFPTYGGAPPIPPYPSSHYPSSSPQYPGQSTPPYYHPTS